MCESRFINLQLSLNAESVYVPVSILKQVPAFNDFFTAAKAAGFTWDEPVFVDNVLST